MTNDDTTSTTSGSGNLTASTMPTSKSAAFSDSGSVNSAPINYPTGHPGTRANTINGDTNPLSEIHAHHVHARLMSTLSASTRPSLLSSVDNELERIDTDESEGVLEFNNWGDEAEDAIHAALAKLAQLARDEHKANPEKTVEQYFSQRLGKLLTQGEVQFDSRYLN
ncbi:hypothetical protein Slin15195_G098650 [Septoria linicola]|uniref:Uncharacterized protein n=1 Tax=Septoria linicola TaxID=215465 RepID=A0A9Q9B569_9PEZI|nr:hypothetical protein Slin14017_G061710 [Septoria linicola]USW56546.1 hypothetical protein Slin15195_G098650 [Septoria linicola]